MASRALLITGATGKQGGSVISTLLAANAPFDIIAVTRNAQSPSAQKLLQKSPKIKLITGDFKAIDDIFHQAKTATKAPIWGVFSVQVPLGSNEEAHGKALVDAALKNGVLHFVYTSADRGPDSDDTPTIVPHFVTKYNIERHLKEKSKGTNMTWTVLRPVAFYDNLTPDFFGKVFTTSFRMRLGEKAKKLQMIATSDVGFFGAQAFIRADAAEYRDKSMSLAGDELSFREMKAIFEKKTGETLPTTYNFLAGLIMRMSKDFGYMFKWMRTDGFGASIEEVRKEKPDMKDFGTWLDTESAWKKG